MSTSKDKKKQVLEIGKYKIPSRITVKRIKRVQELTGIDLCGQDTAPMLEFAIDPIVVLTVSYALYQDHFEKEKISEDDFEELCGAEEITALREEVTDQMKSFSSFWRILATELEGILSGNTSLLDMAEKLQKVQVPSGPTS